MGILSSILKVIPRHRAVLATNPVPGSHVGHNQAFDNNLHRFSSSLSTPSSVTTTTALTHGTVPKPLVLATPQDLAEDPSNHTVIDVARPNKRRQDSDLTFDIETTLSAVAIAMDIVKDIDKGYIDKDPFADTFSPESVPTVEQSRLFDVPEIIRSIAEFLDKPSLAASCRVSRIWYTHCTPLLWRHIVDKNWRDGRFCASIQNQAHYIRSLKCEDWTDYEELLLCEFPRLKSLSLNGSKEPMIIKEKFLGKVQETLSSLVLSAVNPDLLADTTLMSIQSLRQLSTLKLLNLTIKQDQLSMLFLQCHQLEFLSLTRVFFPDEPSDVLESSSQSVLKTKAWTARESTRIKYLTLKEVAITSGYLGALVQKCPGLLELSIARNESLQISLECVTLLKKSCPGLYALDIGSCKQLDKDTFALLFASFPPLTVINLSGTTIADPELLLVAENCKELLRLDIQYCTSITSKGLHQFLSNCGPALRHLESSGVIMDPSTFDNRPWTCTNLQILFVNVGLFAAGESSKMAPGNSTSAATYANPLIEANMTATNRDELDDGGNLKRTFRETDARAGELGDETTGLMTCSTGKQHLLHPLQDINQVQYLGLMGGSPKLTAAKASPLLRAFSSVKRLHVLGLYQAFNKEDLVWLMETLPELCRIDAEHYNISDNLVTWIAEAHPNVRVYRKESDFKR
ncbi:hypothetical protein BGZ83_009846 [Gryganskiella cystojenkinii]|nr:hypothetical protein BGZ83_009846 [Gryganskiella cystojenkinii]